jgi:hypothetical protein
VSNRHKLPVGTAVLCAACGRPCTVGGEPREGERPLTRANTRDGRCATCALAKWLRETPPLGDLIQEQGGKGFRLPHMQKALANMMRVGNCPVAPSEIDWNALADRLDAEAAA